jgi:ubiquitin-conjugating enzyme E2 G1
MASGQKTGAAMLLAKQLKLMQTTDHIPGISVGLVDDKDVFEWEVMLMINDECKFYGGKIRHASSFKLWKARRVQC